MGALSILQIRQGKGPRQYSPGDEERSVLSGFHIPLYKRKRSFFNLNAGDTAGVYTAARVEIAGLFVAQHGAMGMARDQITFFLYRPAGKQPLAALSVAVIFCRAGRVQDADLLQRLPQVPYQEAGQLPEGRIEDVSLMSVGEIQLQTAGSMDRAVLPCFCGMAYLEDYPLVVGKFTAVFQSVVMISVEHIEPVFRLKKGVQPENIAVDFLNGIQTAVFPQFIPVPQLNIGKSVDIVMAEGGKV